MYPACLVAYLIFSVTFTGTLASEASLTVKLLVRLNMLGVLDIQLVSEDETKTIQQQSVPTGDDCYTHNHNHLLGGAGKMQQVCLCSVVHETVLEILLSQQQSTLISAKLSWEPLESCLLVLPPSSENIDEEKENQYLSLFFCLLQLVPFGPLPIYVARVSWLNYHSDSLENVVTYYFLPRIPHYCVAILFSLITSI